MAFFNQWQVFYSFFIFFYILHILHILSLFLFFYSGIDACWWFTVRCVKQPWWPTILSKFNSWWSSKWTWETSRSWVPVAHAGPSSHSIFPSSSSQNVCRSRTQWISYDWGLFRRYNILLMGWCLFFILCVICNEVIELHYYGNYIMTVSWYWNKFRLTTFIYITFQLS